MRWYRAALFSSLQDAGTALHHLEAAFVGRSELIGWQFVSPGLEDTDNYLIVAALARDEFDIFGPMHGHISSALRKGGRFIDLPRGVLDLLFKAWNQALVSTRPSEPNLTFMSTLECRTSEFIPQEGVLVVTSHAKCRECGQSRHKTARLNLCKKCWERVKPSIRREWREIKDRRRLHQAVEAHIESNRQEREHQDQLVALRQLRNSAPPVTGAQTWPATPAEALVEIERMRLAGVPAAGTTERARYMRLHAIAKGIKGGRPLNGPVEVIHPPEVEAAPEAPAEQEQPAPTEESTVAEAAAPEAPTRPRGRGHRANLDEATRREIARLYDDPGIRPVEIKQAYNISDSTLYRIVDELGIQKRTGRPGYVRPGGRKPRQMNLGEAPGAQPAVEATAAEPKDSGPTAPQPKPVVDTQPPRIQVPWQRRELVAQEQGNGRPPVEIVHPLAVPDAPQHAWFVRFTVSTETVIGGGSIDQAIATIRQVHGDNAEIVHIQRA